ncbi:hypothetical protein BJ138DRAFT_20587 [Hygrophoropsis aurantiaca]|uniref:Uncharacterized protein n=1 Tax=Hygrophoropsis aurantiaca TaxID=72124 RepID=A0ACB8AR45_9AGAM|nr:hypothetical protein BJ138DRAFT_20587 [Hygrophoropsis aurantiaca]
MDSEHHDNWADLRPFFSGFVNPHQPENVAQRSLPGPSTILPGSGSALPVYRLSSFGPPTSSRRTGPDSTFLVSTAFPPGSATSRHLPDLVLMSSDSVFFHVHRSVLQAASETAFLISYHTLPLPSDRNSEPMITVQDSSTILNIVLHVIYVRSLANNQIPIKKFVTPSDPLGSFILAFAPLYPLQVYALAAQYDIHDLAVAMSPHLLSANLASVTDELADQMGPRYLKSLFLLHFERVEALKRLLMPPPHPHQPTPTCSSADQSKVARAWTLATAYLIWDSKVDLSTATIKSVIGPIERQIQCLTCRDTLKNRMDALVVQWTNVKRTI